MPDVFYGNPNVEAKTSVDDNGRHYDMNTIRWHELEVPVVELFADMVLGDRNLKSWNVEMYHSESDIGIAKEVVPQSNKAVAAVDFSSDKIAASSVEGIVEALSESGYEVMDIDGLKSHSWGVVRAAIDLSDVFVGSDGDGAAVAFTTDKPAIVCYSYRTTVYFPPYRKNVPFVPLLPDKGLCEHSKVCFPRNSKGEYAKLYSHECIWHDRFCCRNRKIKDDVIRAIRRIGDRA
jgi:hypothetical protein